MLTNYINAAMAKAQYKVLADGMYYGEVPQLASATATGKTQEECEKALQEMVEHWLFKTLGMKHQ